MGRLDGRVALITGAAGAQGRAEAELFAAEGAKVLATDVAPADDGLAAELGSGVEYRQLDISDEAQWAETVEFAQSKFGKLDTLVNNAGIQDMAGIAETPLALWDRIMNVNLRGSFLGIKTAAPALEAAGGGAIVNISSVAGTRGLPFETAYGVSKWGIRGLSQYAAVELAPKGIRVNSLLPGAIDTPMLDNHSQDLLDEFVKWTPLGRLGKPAEVAAAALWLVSDEASYVVGAELPVDGGVRA